MSSYRLHAIFSSLQGEGRNAGRPATFVRFASCNLACPWCDTHKSVKMVASEDDVVRAARKYGNRMVVVTGGEPTIQPGIDRLLEALKADGRWLALETNGLKAPERPELYDYIAVSPKSDYAARYLEGEMLRRANEVRIVAVNEDLAPFCRNMRNLIEADDYYISPLEKDGRIHYQRAMKVMEKANRASGDAFPPWALSIQQHKVLGIR